MNKRNYTMNLKDKKSEENESSDDENKEKTEESDQYIKAEKVEGVKSGVNQDALSNNVVLNEVTNYEIYNALNKEENNNKQVNIDYERQQHLSSLVKTISDKLLKHTERNDVMCHCESMVPNETIFDIFKNYGILCYCMINHIKNIPFDSVLFMEMFILEFNLVNFLKEDTICISEILKSKPLISEDKDDQYICAYSTFIRDINIHINCEEAIESLTYKYFKNFYNKIQLSDIYCLDYLLFLLYIRRESERYFYVYSEAQKTTYNSRITLLLSLHKNCCKSSDSILKNIKGYITKNTGLIKIISDILLNEEENEGPNQLQDENLNTREIYKDEDLQTLQNEIDELNTSFERTKIMKKFLIKRNQWDNIMFNKYDEVFSSNITKIERINIDKICKEINLSRESSLILIRITVVLLHILDLESDIDEWIEFKKEKYDWFYNVKSWAKNRNQKLDADMISCCSTYKRFDEGFLIYSELIDKNEQAMTRTCSLCLNAFKFTENRIWLDRINQILHASFSDHAKETWENLTMLIFENLRLLTEEGRKNVIINIFEYFEKFNMDKDEHLIKCLLQGFFIAISEYKEKNLCYICHEYAILIYKKWKSKKYDWASIFKKKTTDREDIYSYILGICDESNDCDKFHEVCSDILNHNENIGNRVLCRLEKYHQKCQCQKYSGYNHQNEKHQCKKLLKHCMTEFKE